MHFARLASTAVLLATLTHMPSFAAVQENVEYTRIGDVSLRMDLNVPEGKGPFPAVILVHGGGWIAGDRKVEVKPLFQPLTDAGFAWFSISYRLANDPMQFGAAIQDVESAVRYVRAHASEFNIDPNRIALVGESAGAHLAAMAALTGPVDTHVAAVVAFYGPTDLVTLAKTSPHVPSFIRDQVRGTPFENLLMAALQQLSPVNHITRDMPPFLLIHGTADNLVPYSQSEQFYDRAKAVGAPCELFPVAGAGHGLRWWNESRSAASQAKLVQWLRAQIGSPATTTPLPGTATPVRLSSTASSADPHR